MFSTRISYCTLAASTLALGVTAGQATAATLLDVDWDTKNPEFGYAYDFQAGGTVDSSAAETATGGVGGSAGYSLTADSTNAANFPGSYWGAGVGIEGATPTALDGAASGADLLFSADILAEGLTGTTATIKFKILFRDGGGTLWKAIVNKTYTTPGSFQTLSGDLSGASTESGSLAALLASTDPIDIRVEVEMNPGHSRFGFDAGNVMTIDNLVVSTVPEPASLALLAAGGLCLVRRRR